MKQVFSNFNKMFSIILKLLPFSANLKFGSVSRSDPTDNSNFQKMLWEILNFLQSYSSLLLGTERRNFSELTSCVEITSWPKFTSLLTADYTDN